MLALLWIAGALSSFSFMAVGARELSGDIPTLQTLFVRSIVGLLIVLTIILYKKDVSLFQTQKLNIHLFRNIIHFAGQYGWFLGIGLLPLAEVFALEFTVPFWTAIIAFLFLNEKLNSRKLIAIILGFVGVLVIVQPGIAIIDTMSLIVLAAAICYAITHSTTKFLSSSEHPLTILFYMCLVQLPIGFVLSIAHWVTPNLTQFIWLVLVGLMALSAHFCLTKAMQKMEATLVVTLDFFRLPLIACVGVWFYSEDFEISLFIGGLIMLLANLIYRQSKYS